MAAVSPRNGPRPTSSRPTIKEEKAVYYISPVSHYPATPPRYCAGTERRDGARMA